jgi:hypothetical protein
MDAPPGALHAPVRHGSMKIGDHLLVVLPNALLMAVAGLLQGLL